MFADILPAGGVQRGLRRPRHRRARWSAHPIPGMVSITGSTQAGKAVARSAADTVKRTHLELGGKAPVVVFDDADLAAAAEGIAVAGYFNAGQDCTAATRVLASRAVHDEFTAALVEQAQADQAVERRATDDDAFYIPPVNNERPSSATSPGWVERLPAHAKVVTGGQRIGERGYFYSPTIVDELRQDDELGPGPRSSGR